VPHAVVTHATCPFLVPLGLERGLEGMKMGGERVITIPSKLGYGSKGSGNDIPPDADLVFEVKVLKVG
jgi:FKBP-type peptidyl-prolyl cis-trans isomerase